MHIGVSACPYVFTCVLSTTYPYVFTCVLSTTHKGPVDNATVGHGHVVTSVVDLWLCSNPCTPDNPCLWNLATDPGEREEVSAENPQVVASMKSRLLELSASFKYNPPMMGSNDVFCQHVKERGGFLGPWIPSL